MTIKELEKVGLAIYACEGTKLRKDKRRRNGYLYAIEVTNSNPGIIRIFLRFMRETLKIRESKLHGQLFVYEELDKKGLEKFWSQQTRIPVSRLNKTIMLKQKNSKYSPNERGTFKIRYYDKGLRLKLERMIEQLLES